MQANHPILGAHESIAGGYCRAVERARDCNCDCVQLFTKNNSQWAAKDLAPADVDAFRQALHQLDISHPLAHGSYLVNLATSDSALWQRSLDALAVELRRADTLGIPYLVVHPGSFTTGTLEVGIRNVIRALDQVHQETAGIRTGVLLETTAGQGTCIGCRFEHLAEILSGIAHPDRVNVCFDTCHVFAAGYPLSRPRSYEATMAKLDRIVGLDRIKAFHLNDSRRERGSRVDRHAHIGRGKMGLAPFRNLLNDARFRGVPMYLETPKEKEDGVDLDVINLQTLRGLIR